MANSQSSFTLLAEAVERCPDKVAVVFPEQRQTYAQLLSSTYQAARALAALGLGVGDRMGLWLPNCMEWIHLQLAASFLGITTVPINVRYRTDEATHIISDADLQAIFVADEVGSWKRDLSGLVTSIVSDLSGFPSLRAVISLNESDRLGITTYSDFLSAASDSDEPVAAPELAPDHVAHVQYTSGTTAFPKGAMLRGSAVYREAHVIAAALDLHENDVLVAGLPFYHLAGFVAAMSASFAAACRFVTMTHFDAAKTLQLIQEEHGTIIRGVETMFIAMLEHSAFATTDLSSLRGGWCGGFNQSVQQAILDRMGVNYLINNFGMSETTSASAISHFDDPDSKRTSTSGRPIEGAEIRIVDPEGDDVLAPDERGEICVRGWNVMVGYLNMPEETARVLAPDGWLRTGDRGYLDPEGYLHFVDRLVDGIRVGGENVSANEVETSLARCPGVAEAYVVAADDARLGQVPVAFVRRNREELTEENVIDWCAERMASFKVPRHVVFVSEFPQTGIGKVQKFKLKQQAREHLAAIAG
jgi:fatty-acyl-CoA synthase